MEKTRKMEKQKESKLNWALTVVDSKETLMSYKISGKTEEGKEGLGWGEKANVLHVLVTFRLSQVLTTIPRCFIYEVFILNCFFISLDVVQTQSNHNVTLETLLLFTSICLLSESFYVSYVHPFFSLKFR